MSNFFRKVERNQKRLNGDFGSKNFDDGDKKLKRREKRKLIKEAQLEKRREREALENENKNRDKKLRKQQKVG